MLLDIRPEPTDEEHAAILAALDHLLASDDGRGTTEWWAAGVRENVEDEEG